MFLIILININKSVWNQKSCFANSWKQQQQQKQSDSLLLLNCLQTRMGVNKAEGPSSHAESYSGHIHLHIPQTRHRAEGGEWSFLTIIVCLTKIRQTYLVWDTQNKTQREGGLHGKTTFYRERQHFVNAYLIPEHLVKYVSNVRMKSKKSQVDMSEELESRIETNDTDALEPNVIMVSTLKRKIYITKHCQKHPNSTCFACSISILMTATWSHYISLYFTGNVYSENRWSPVTVNAYKREGCAVNPQLALRHPAKQSKEHTHTQTMYCTWIQTSAIRQHTV